MEVVRRRGRDRRMSMWVGILIMHALGPIHNGSEIEESQGKKKGRKERDDIPWQKR